MPSKVRSDFLEEPGRSDVDLAESGRFRNMEEKGPLAKILHSL